MPFTTQADRKKIDNLTKDQIQAMLENPCFYLRDITVGDKCYYFYKKMVEKFKKERRWTTAHNIYTDMQTEIQDRECPIKGWAIDTCRAYELAWQVFFQIHVMSYEFEKQQSNGEI